VQIVVERCAAGNLDIGDCDSGLNGHSVPPSAPGARHPECGSHPGNPALFKPATKRGGARPGSGPKRKARPANVLPTPRWYCVQVQPRTEGAVVADLEVQGFTAFVPRYRERPEGGQTVGRLRCALPQFVMVEFDQAIQPWSVICSTRHVVRLLGSHPERPSPVRPAEAEWLVKQFGPQGEQRWHETQRTDREVEMPAGAAVRIKAGPLVDRQGIVVWSDGRSAEIDMDGRRVALPQALLEARG
jgi:transcription antitermination factor NusG